jgi:hypothetical protein
LKYTNGTITETTIKPSAYGSHKPTQFRKPPLKIMPYTLAISGRQHRHRCDGKYFDDFILVDVDKANRCVHQEIDFAEQKRSRSVQRIDITHIRRIFNLIFAAIIFGASKRTSAVYPSRCDEYVHS